MAKRTKISVEFGDLELFFFINILISSSITFEDKSTLFGSISHFSLLAIQQSWNGMRKSSRNDFRGNCFSTERISQMCNGMWQVNLVC